MAYKGENSVAAAERVGFDDFRGFNLASDMYTEWRDVHANPCRPISGSFWSHPAKLAVQSA